MMRTWYYRAKTLKFLLVIIGLCAILTLMGMLPRSSSAQGPIEVLEDTLVSPASGWSQAISGDVVVYEYTMDGSTDIYGYDLSTHTGFTVTDGAASPAWPDVSDNTIVWMDQRNGNWDIYGYDLCEDHEFQITNHAADQQYPVVDDQTVVWVDWRHGGDYPYGYDIYGYDLTSGTEFRISSHSVPVGACLAISGNVVVWTDRRYGEWNLYGYDLNSRTESQITHWGVSSPYCPAVSNGVIVLGQGNMVYGIDLFGNLLFETRTLFYPFYGRPAIDGNIVVWQERFGDICLYYPCSVTVVGYDVTSQHKFVIPLGVHEAWFPAISGHVVVWRDVSTAFEISPSPPPPAVYASRLLETVQLRPNTTSVSPGDPVTYTITLAEATITGVLRSITNTLPLSVTLDLPSLQATSGDYGYDPAMHLITWTGTVSSVTPITITYRVQVDPTVSFGGYITNTAIISDQTDIFARTVSTWVARRTYLPVVMRGFHSRPDSSCVRH